MQSMGRDELLVVIPPDDHLVRDILMYKRTEKYIKQTMSVTQQEAIKHILTDKSFQNRERYAELQKQVQKLLGKAKLFIAGTEIEIGGEDAQSRIVKGFHELITRVYPNLRMLRGINYTEADITTCLNHSQEGLFSGDVTTLAESEQEVLAFIQSNNRGGVRTTLKSLLERFERKPYGWYYAAILCTLAKLCVRGKVELRTDGNLLEEDDLERAIRNSHGHGNVVLEPQVDFTASQVRNLREFHVEFFDSPPGAGEAKSLGKETGVAFQDLRHTLTPLVAQVLQYPFLSALTPVLETLKELCGKPYTWYLTELLRQEDALLDLKEQVIDPIRKFMSGSQKGIFDDARKFVQDQQPNFSYISGDEPTQLVTVLADPECFKGNRVQQLKALLDRLETTLSAQRVAELAQAKEAVQTLKSRLCNMAEFSVLTPEQQQQLTQPFEAFSEELTQQKLIAVMRENLRRFEETTYQRSLSKLMDWSQPAPPPGASSRPSDETKPVTVPTYGGAAIANPGARVVAESKIVLCKAVKVDFDTPWLADEADIDRYLAAMRKALLAEIQDGKRIQI